MPSPSCLGYGRHRRPRGWERLRSYSPLVVKEAPECADLGYGHGEDDQQVEAGPEGDPPQVVLQQVAVTSLERPEDALDLPALLQVTMHRLQGLLQ